MPFLHILNHVAHQEASWWMLESICKYSLCTTSAIHWRWATVNLSSCWEVKLTNWTLFTVRSCRPDHDFKLFRCFCTSQNLYAHPYWNSNLLPNRYMSNNIGCLIARLSFARKRFFNLVSGRKSLFPRASQNLYASLPGNTQVAIDRFVIKGRIECWNGPIYQCSYSLVWLQLDTPILRRTIVIILLNY